MSTLATPGNARRPHRLAGRTWIELAMAENCETKSGPAEPTLLRNQPELTSQRALGQLAVVWLVTLVLILPTILYVVQLARTAPFNQPSWVTGDIDTGLITQGLRDTKTPADTLRWWSGTWVGIVPFYRPLTSYLFWIEWQAFGEYEPAYLYPTIALHAVGTLIFAGFAWSSARWFAHPWPVAAGALAGAAFSGLLSGPRRGVASAAYMAWKNQPDLAAALFAVGALWLYLQSIRGRRGALPGAMLLYLLACGFKEIAVPLPAVCLFLERDLRFWRNSAWKRLVAMGLVGMFFLTVRFLALRGVGYTYGSNDAAVLRTLSVMLGPFALAVLGNWLIPVTVLLTTAVLVAAWRRCQHRKETGREGRSSRWRERLWWVPWAGGWLVAVAALGCADIGWSGGRDTPDMLTLEGWLFGLIHLAITAGLNEAHQLGIALVVLALLWRQAPRLLRFGFMWVLIFLLPLTLSPGPVHRYYLPEGGYCLLTGLGLAWLPTLLPVLRDRTGQRSGSAIN